MTTATSQLSYLSEQAEAQPFVLGHRPELDGLRGVSILLVLILHLRVYELTGIGLPGGFLGVDIFFVLSGFLITTLLVQEFDRTGSISLKGFYLRRVLRLLPALFVLIPIVYLAASFTDLKDETFTGAWLALSYISNWLYAFKVYSAHNPFGVTWSLAIEEQFYLFWPLLFALALKLKVRRGWILSALIFTVVFIALHRLTLTTQDAGWQRMYYATDTRADGLLIGCIVGLLLSWGLVPQTKIVTLGLKVLAVLGTVLLAWLALTMSNGLAVLYLGGFTLIALAIGIMLLSLMIDPPQLALSALRFGPLVWLGKVSYGLYLWHWAVIALVFPKYGPPSLAQLISVTALALALTATSFYLVEKRCLALKDRLANDNRKRAPLIDRR